MGGGYRSGAELLQTEYGAHAGAFGAAGRSGRRQPAAALEHPRLARSSFRVAPGRAGDSRAAGDAQNVAGSHGEFTDSRLCGAHRQIHQAVLAERRYRCLSHSILCH